MSAADAATKSKAQTDLGGHASRMTQNMADDLKEAADDVVKDRLQSIPKPEHLKEAAMGDLDLKEDEPFPEKEHRLLAEPEGSGGRCRGRN